MLYYGDGRVRVSVREEERALRAFFGSARDELLVRSGQLAQGVLDVRFRDRGEVDDDDDATRALHLQLVRIARGEAPASDLFSRVCAADDVSISTPEGFAFYSVHPELFAASARRLRAEVGPRSFVVIGIRSIGTTLGAVVAAELEARVFTTVRPTGHPFARQLRTSERMADALLGVRDAHFVIVDEGPGLSGSSLASVAKWLLDRGVAQERITFLPSHAGEPGAEARDEARMIWSNTRRIVTSFEDYFLSEERRLLRAFEDVLQSPVRRWRDLSGGRWRTVDDAVIFPTFEKRKLLLDCASGVFLAKFAGLGQFGREKFAHAQRLADAGVTVLPVGLTHGFIVQPWVERAALTAANAAGNLRAASDYLRVLASQSECPAGASPSMLLEMIEVNAEESQIALGEVVRRLLYGAAASLVESARPIRGDHRMHRWEWLATDRGIIKTDALDHCLAHDLVGPQDLLWDVVGAAEELLPEESDRLTFIEEIARRERRHWASDEILFTRMAYAAFEIAACDFARKGGASEGDARRLQERQAELTARLATLAAG